MIELHYATIRCGDKSFQAIHTTVSVLRVSQPLEFTHKSGGSYQPTDYCSQEATLSFECSHKADYQWIKQVMDEDIYINHFIIPNAFVETSDATLFQDHIKVEIRLVFTTEPKKKLKKEHLTPIEEFMKL